MATIKEDRDSDVESLYDSEFDSVLSESDTSIEFAFDQPLPPIRIEQRKNLEDDSDTGGNATVAPSQLRRFPLGRRASCPSIMGWDKDRLKYLVAGSKTLPEPVVSRAYQSLLSHTEPILTQNKPKEKRLLSYYDYVPSRRVYNERDQLVKDQNRDVLKFDLMIEERRKHQEAIAMERELMGEDYDDVEDGDEDEEALEDIMMKRRLRRLNVTDSAYQGFFPQMDLYDFGQLEKERQKQAHTSHVRTNGRVQRRGSMNNLKRRDTQPMVMSNVQHGQSGSRTERQLTRRESFSNDLNQAKSSDHNPHSNARKLDRTNTQTKINALQPSQSSRQHRFVSSAHPPATQNKYGSQEMKLQVLSAMRSRFPEVHRTNSGMIETPNASGKLRYEKTTAPGKLRRQRSMSLGNTSVLMPSKLLQSVPQEQ